MMSFLKSILLSYCAGLSLDVVAGGVIFTLAVGQVAEVELPWSIPTALGCCIWLIYTLDHLIDGIQSRSKRCQVWSDMRFIKNIENPFLDCFVISGLFWSSSVVFPTL